MGKLQESIITIVNRPDLLEYTTLNVLFHNQPFANILLRDYMSTGENIIIDKLTPEMHQIIRYNNGYLEHKYKIQYL